MGFPWAAHSEPIQILPYGKAGLNSSSAHLLFFFKLDRDQVTTTNETERTFPSLHKNSFMRLCNQPLSSPNPSNQWPVFLSL